MGCVFFVVSFFSFCQDVKFCWIFFVHYGMLSISIMNLNKSKAMENSLTSEGNVEGLSGII